MVSPDALMTATVPFSIMNISCPTSPYLNTTCSGPGSIHCSGHGSLFLTGSERRTSDGVKMA